MPFVDHQTHPSFTERTIVSPPQLLLLSWLDIFRPMPFELAVWRNLLSVSRPLILLSLATRPFSYTTIRATRTFGPSLGTHPPLLSATLHANDCVGRPRTGKGSPPIFSMNIATPTISRARAATALGSRGASIRRPRLAFPKWLRIP